MIKVDKGKEPDLLQTDIVNLAIEKLEEFYKSNDRSQKRYSFPFNTRFDSIAKPILHDRFHGKCGYCEIEIKSPEKGIVDRFRPFNGVRDNKEYYQDLYWWLVYDWDNLVYSCQECNQYKANYFPIKGTRVITKSENFEKEEKLLISPSCDEPELHFTYNTDGSIISKTEAGNQTIQLIRLNRDRLIEKRIKVKKDIEDLIYNVLNVTDSNNKNIIIPHLIDIFKGRNLEIEFLSFKQWVILSELDDKPKLYTILNLVPKLKPVAEIKNEKFLAGLDRFLERDLIVNDYFPIDYIHIKNFKGITDLMINFREDEINNKSWLFLLGENGVGKSSILQAIAIGLSPDVKFLKPYIGDLIKKGENESFIVIKERDKSDVITTVLTRKTLSIKQDGKFNSFLCGYGSLRLSKEDTEINESPDLKKVSYVNLFKPIVPLNDITKWLKHIHKNNPDLFERIAFSIKRLLPDDFTNNELTIVKDEIVFKNSQKSFSELSDGYKSTIILAVDIMMKLSSSQADMDKMTGIVLIDELGNQLHPRWQMRIVNQLRTVFPNINFIISTHHPLCLRGSKLGEVILLKNLKNEIIQITELPDPASLRVDQILSSEFFGLSSLIDPEIEASFNRYYELLSIENLDQKDTTELNQLKDELRGKNHLGATLREELMYTVIDKLLAQKVFYDKNPLNRTQLKEEAIRRVWEIWSKLNLNEDDKG